MSRLRNHAAMIAVVACVSAGGCLSSAQTKPVQREHSPSAPSDPIPEPAPAPPDLVSDVAEPVAPVAPVTQEAPANSAPVDEETDASCIPPPNERSNPTAPIAASPAALCDLYKERFSAEIQDCKVLARPSKHVAVLDMGGFASRYVELAMQTANGWTRVPGDRIADVQGSGFTRVGVPRRRRYEGGSLWLIKSRTVSGDAEVGWSMEETADATTVCWSSSEGLPRYCRTFFTHVEINVYEGPEVGNGSERDGDATQTTFDARAEIRRDGTVLYKRASDSRWYQRGTDDRPRDECAELAFHPPGLSESQPAATDLSEVASILVSEPTAAPAQIALATPSGDLIARIEATGQLCYENAPGHRAPLRIKANIAIGRGRRLVAVESECIFTYSHLIHFVLVDGTTIQPAPFARRPDWAKPTVHRWSETPQEGIDPAWAEASISGATLFRRGGSVYVEATERKRVVGDGGVAELYRWNGRALEQVLVREQTVTSEHIVTLGGDWPIVAPAELRCAPELVVGSEPHVLTLIEHGPGSHDRQTTLIVVDRGCEARSPMYITCGDDVTYAIRSANHRWHVMRSDDNGVRDIFQWRQRCTLRPEGLPSR